MCDASGTQRADRSSCSSTRYSLHPPLASMSSSEICFKARVSFETIRKLKTDFDFAFEQAVTSGKAEDVEAAQRRKQVLETKMKELQRELWMVEVERLFDLKKQYEGQLDFLKKAGMVQTKIEKGIFGVEHEVYFIKGIDENEYPIPSYDAIVQRLFEQKELFEMKADQGFKKLVLVPFGASFHTTVDQYKSVYKDYKKMVPSFALDGRMPCWLMEEFVSDEPFVDNLEYSLGTLGADGEINLKGKRKQEILREATEHHDALGGWRVLLVQGARENKPGFRSIPRTGQGITDGTILPRTEIEAGNNVLDFFANKVDTASAPHPEYAGENGMAPEDWLVVSMQHLLETGKPLDDYRSGTDSIAVLTDAAFPSLNSQSSEEVVPGVPVAYWDRDVSRTDLSATYPARGENNYGIRTAVRV